MATMLTPQFSENLHINLSHPLNGRLYTLLRADARQASPQHAVDIAAVCNEPLVYDRLFRERIQGRPYTVQDGEAFLTWATAGWLEGTHFVFLLLDADGHVAGALDVKSPQLDAGEVGYWLGGEHRGIMTVALKAMIEVAREAGFQRLWARLDTDNLRSFALLERAGFTVYCPTDATPGKAYLERHL